jgi:hypothetical protein
LESRRRKGSEKIEVSPSPLLYTFPCVFWPFFLTESIREPRLPCVHYEVLCCAVLAAGIDTTNKHCRLSLLYNVHTTDRVGNLWKRLCDRDLARIMFL